MLFLDVAVFCELKRRNALREARNEAQMTKSSKKSRKPRGGSSANVSHVSTSASETPRSRLVCIIHNLNFNYFFHWWSRGQCV